MKIKSKHRGLFYKNKGKWFGPIEGVLFTSKDAPDWLLEESVKYKAKLKVFRQCWKSVK